ncbi:FAD-dependent monooxygenase [Streptomyces sp. NPDC005438]|uniref:FAD-dependent monooxygenase n=1 Tax=Streptomyces sp. NPDC005438 TaxID=3156880 RepID=UPI0033B5B62D
MLMRGGNVAVVGGSVAGCAAALAAARGGAERITVLERASGELRERGVGLGIHQDRFAELESAGYVDDSMPWCPMNQRIWTVRDGDDNLGRAIAVHPMPFRAYSWGSLWSELRKRVPDSVDYRSGVSVSEVKQADDPQDGVTLQLTDGSEEHFDLVIGADGYRSVVRDTMFPDLRPTYAGYVLIRGVSPDLPQLAPGGEGPLAGPNLPTVVFPGGHCIMYRIPHPEGGYRVNWAVYTLLPEHLEKQLDPSEPTSVPPGSLTSELAQFGRDLASEHFPPYWTECVQRTPQEQTFVQPIYDMEVPSYTSGRLLLAGDAATVARPHTGGGAVKALQDGLALEEAWKAADSWEELLNTYNSGRVAIGSAMVEVGRRLGAAQVTDTPDWASMDADDLAAWWKAANEKVGFGGLSVKRD